MHRTICSRPIAAAAVAAIPMTVRSTHAPITSCGAPMAFGCSRRRLGQEFTAVEHWNAECVGWHVCKRQPLRRPQGSPTSRPRPARPGGDAGISGFCRADRVLCIQTALRPSRPTQRRFSLAPEQQESQLWKEEDAPWRTASRSCRLQPLSRWTMLSAGRTLSIGCAGTKSVGMPIPQYSAAAARAHRTSLQLPDCSECSNFEVVA